MRKINRIFTVTSTIMATFAVAFMTLTPAQAINPNPVPDGGGAPAAGSPANPTGGVDSDPQTVREDLEPTQWFIDAVAARETAAGDGEGVIVAVLSDGVWAGHPDLTGKVLDGYDVINKRVISASTVREPGDTDAAAGTFASAIIAGTADRAGVRGIAPSARILPVVVDSAKTVNDAQIAAGVDWATAHGADVIVYVGGLSAALIIDTEKATCASISAARAKGVLTFVAAGNNFEVFDPKFFPARCTDAVAVAPLSDTLGEAHGFRNVVTPSFAAPAARIVSATATLDWMPYESDNLADWAPVIAAASAAVLISDGLDPEAALGALVKTATDIGAKGPDGISGAGIIDLSAARGESNPRTEADVTSAIAGSSVPTIESVTSDKQSSVGITWEPPVGVTPTGYRVDVYQWDTVSWKLRSFLEQANTVRAVLPVKIDSGTLYYFTVTAITADSDRTSAPSNTYTSQRFEAGPNAYAAIKTVNAIWVKDGLEVSVTTNEAGVGAPWTMTVLDGWTTAVLFANRVSNSTTFLWRQPTDSDKRIMPLYVTATINGEKVNVGVRPQYLLDAKGLSAGKSYAAVTGTAYFACMDTIKVMSGCEGALVKVINTANGKVVGTGRIMSDLTFTIIFPWKSSRLNVQVRIDDPRDEVESQPIDRLLTTRK